MQFIMNLSSMISDARSEFFVFTACAIRRPMNEVLGANVCCDISDCIYSMATYSFVDSRH
jgi:hypothetical protein